MPDCEQLCTCVHYMACQNNKPFLLNAGTLQFHSLKQVLFIAGGGWMANLTFFWRQSTNILAVKVVCYLGLF